MIEFVRMVSWKVYKNEETLKMSFLLQINENKCFSLWFHFWYIFMPRPRPRLSFQSNSNSHCKIVWFTKSVSQLTKFKPSNFFVKQIRRKIQDTRWYEKHIYIKYKNFQVGKTWIMTKLNWSKWSFRCKIRLKKKDRKKVQKRWKEIVIVKNLFFWICN